MARRRRALNGRPLLRQGGGRWLHFGIQWSCAESGLTRGALVGALSQRLGTGRDRIYRVLRGDLGMAPDALWRVGVALHELGVWWMSGPLALALEPRYDAHLLGTVGELVLDPEHFMMRAKLQDFLLHRAEFREPTDRALNLIKACAWRADEQALFEAAWQRWYAFDASELATKEQESQFAGKAPALAQAVSLLRAQQRDDDSEARERAYSLQLHILNKYINEYFEIGGFEQKPLYPRPRYPVEREPRFNLLSTYGQSAFGQQLRRWIAPGKRRPSAREAYRNGWNVVEGSSGLLALALLDYEREYYILLARIVQPLHLILSKDEERTQADEETLRGFKSWWQSLWAITCLIGPLGDPLGNLYEDLADKLTLPALASVSDLQEKLFAESPAGGEFRKIIAIPAHVAKELSWIYVRVTYDASNYPSSTTPKELNALLAMLHGSDSYYPPDQIRTELFWWFAKVAARLDAVN